MLRLLVPALLLAPPVLAQDGGEAAPEEAHVRETAELDQETLDAAEAIFFHGVTHFRAGEYEQAAVRFQKAYVLTGHRDMLYNVARSREKLGDKEGAVRWYRSYLQSEPADETAVIHRIRQLGGDPTPAPPPVKKQQKSRSEPEGPILVEEGPGVWPWVAVGVGAAAVVGGIALGSSALSDAQAARASDDRSEAQSLKTSAETSAVVADVLYGVGVVGIGVATWLWLDADSKADPDTHLEVGATSESWSVGWSGRF